jgi:hypothetical protein
MRRRPAAEGGTARQDDELGRGYRRLAEPAAGDDVGGECVPREAPVERLPR